MLSKKREDEKDKLDEPASKELNFAVTLNVAAAYHANKMYREALDLYSKVVKSKRRTY